MNTAASLIAGLQEKGKEREKLLDILAMWEEVKAQGFDPDDVEAFTFKDEYLSREQKRLKEFAARHLRPDPTTDKFNCVRLKDGTCHQLKPMIRKR